MSRRPHPASSGLCGAELHLVRIPWINGRRSTIREPFTLFCDEPAGHEAAGRPHRCRETGERWREHLNDVFLNEGRWCDHGPRRRK